MGRPASLPQDRFTSKDLTLAAGLSPRNFGLLVEQDLAPPGEAGAGGQAGHRVWDSRGLQHAALLGALHLAGLELLVAARLAAAVTKDMSLFYGRLPSNLRAFLQAPLNPRPGHTPWEGGFSTAQSEDDYWLHHALRTASDIYRPHETVRGDYLLEVADNQFVITRHHGSKVDFLSPASSAQLKVNPEFRIIGKGGEVRVVRIHEEVESLNFHADPVAAAAYTKVETEYVRAYDNAVTLLSVNASLAIRNAFDRVLDERSARRARAVT